MKFDAVVVGAGVIGVTTAFYLHRKGLEVAVIDRSRGPALETSYANGGQISVSHAEPWANPSAPWQVLKWLNDKNSPLFFKPKADINQLKWLWNWLCNCTQARTDTNTAHLTLLAKESQQELHKVRTFAKIRYNQLERGIIHFYQDGKQFEQALHAAEVMRQAGLIVDVITTSTMTEMEPALRSIRDRIIGGTYAPTDESGDCALFTERLANYLESNGVRFFYDTQALDFNVNDESMLHTISKGATFDITAKNFFLCMGSFTKQFVEYNFKRDLLIYPCKGSSVTVPIVHSHLAPTISLTDDENKIVFSRLGKNLRIAGTAELIGWDNTLNVERCKTIEDKARNYFGDACDWSKSLYWSGLRPTTPTNLPYIERLSDNVFINAGHGTLGWTLACGSAKRVTDLL